MDAEQPYRPPREAMSRPTAEGSTVVSASMTSSLSRTGPWVLFLGVLGMGLCALIFLAAVAVVVAGTIPGAGELGPLGTSAIGAVYLLLAILYFFPSLYLLRYGMAIRRIGPRADAVALEDALRQQASFWRLVGILMAVMLALYGLVFVVGVGAAVLGLVGAPA